MIERNFVAAMITGTIIAAGTVFFGIAMMLRIEELDDVTAMVRRKLRRFSK